MKSPPKELFDKRNSLVYWFPKIEKLQIPFPKTAWVATPPDLCRKLLDGTETAWKEFQPYLDKIKEAAKNTGYPAFIRTDMASAKHGWEEAAFVRHEGELANHLMRTIEHNEMAGFIGLNYSAIVIREFLELDWRFTAFHGKMPVAKERRYFIKKGKVLCHHPYWIKEAIAEAHKNEGKRGILGYFAYRLPNKWEKMLEEINTESAEEIRLLSNYCERIAAVVSGYWSVDFACTRKGEWILIDMALGEASYHASCSRSKNEA